MAALIFLSTQLTCLFAVLLCLGIALTLAMAALIFLCTQFICLFTVLLCLGIGLRAVDALVK